MAQRRWPSKIELEASETRELIRSLVQESLRELLAENQWIEQLIQEEVDRAMKKVAREARLAGPTRGVR